MKAESIKKRIIKLGGQVFEDSQSNQLSAELGNYDIEFYKNDSRFFTSRSKDKRGYYDPGSDCNPSGYIFHYKLKELDNLIGGKDD